MIVVDKGKKYIGRDVEIEITQIIQTNSGRMLFSNFVKELQKPHRTLKSTRPGGSAKASHGRQSSGSTHKRKPVNKNRKASEKPKNSGNRRDINKPEKQGIRNR